MAEQQGDQSGSPGEGRRVKHTLAGHAPSADGVISNVAHPSAAEPVSQRPSLIEFFSADDVADRIFWVEENRPTNFVSRDDVLGKARAGGTDVRGEQGRVVYKRPTWKYSNALRENLRAVIEQMSDEEIHHFIENQLPSVLLVIAEIRIPLQDIHTTDSMISIMQEVFSNRRSEKWGRGMKAKYGPKTKEPNEQTTSIERSEDDGEEKLDVVRLELAHHLVYRTAFQEGLLGKNESGFLPDTTSSLANNETALMTSIEVVSQVLAEQPTLFGERTRDIYGGFSKRLNRTRTMFHGVRVDPRDFPPFPTPQTES